MLILWITFFAPTLVLTLPFETSVTSNKTGINGTESAPGHVSGKPFIGIGAGWNPFYNMGRDFQVKADVGVSNLLSDFGNTMTAISNIFEILLGPSKKENPKSYGNSPNSDIFEFLGPMEKFLGIGGASGGCKNCTNSEEDGKSTDQVIMETEIKTDLPTTDFTTFEVMTETSIPT